MARDIAAPARRPHPASGTDLVGERDRRTDPAGQRGLVRRLRGGVRAPVRGARREGHVQEARPDQAPQLVLRRLRPQRRRARRGPHLHLLREGGGRRPDQQLEGPRRDAGDLHRARTASSAARMRGRTMYVVPFCMGPLGSPLSAHRRRDHRLRLRRRVHAHHDPHGTAASSTSSATTASSSRPCTRVGAPLGRARRTSPWPCNATKYISHFPETARSGPTAPATAATRCSARSATPCASPPSWPATRAGSPSTC